MKKIIKTSILFLFLCFSLKSFSQKDTLLEAKEYYSPQKGYTYIPCFKPSLKCKYTYYLKDGGKIKHGERIIYFRNGKIEYITIFKDDAAHGIAKSYFQSGKIRRKHKLNRGESIKSIKYFENGNIKWIEKYNSNSIIRFRKTYYENGKLKSKGHYCTDYFIIRHRDLKNGDHNLAAFTKDNILIEKENHSYQMQQTIKNFYTDNDDDDVYFPHKAYLKDKTWKYWDEKGKLIRKEIYNKGKLLELKK